MNPLFSYFTALVESYSRVIQPKSETLQRHEAYADRATGIMECRRAGEYRQAYLDYQQRMQRLEEGENDGGLDAEDSEMTEEVDWHDFMVVE